MHGPAGQTGRLYEFSVDGSLLLRQGGKYSHGSWWENTILMTEPWKNFPSPRSGAVPSGRWATATVSLLAGRSRWQGDGEYVRDSVQGVFEVARGMPFIKQTNPLPTHRLWGNYNVFTHADDSALTSLPLYFVLVPAKGTACAIDGGQYVGSSNPGTDTPMTLTIENLRLVGPKGEKPVGDLGAFGDTEVVFTPPSMDRARNKRFDHQRLTGGERQAAVKIVAGSKPGTALADHAQTGYNVHPLARPRQVRSDQGLHAAGPGLQVRWRHLGLAPPADRLGHGGTVV